MAALIICPDQGMMAELVCLLSRQSCEIAAVELSAYPNPADLPDILSSQSPEACFIDLLSDPVTGSALIVQMAELVPRVGIVSLLGRADPDLILGSLRQGASEFLVRPFTADQLEAVLSKLAKVRPDRRSAQPASATVYCVMPAKGACGATTIACNLARQFKRGGIDKVLLADMDPLTGTVSFVLNLKSHYSFVDALSHAENLDEVWKSLIVTAPPGDVILSPANPVDGIMDGQDPEPIVHYCRGHYQRVILDCSGPYGHWNLSLAKLADRLLLITTNELPPLHSTKRALAWLARQGIEHSKIGLVVNRFSRYVGLTRADIESALPAEILAVIPSDYQTMQKALMEGKPAPPGSAIGKSIAELAARLEGHEAPRPPKPGWFNSWF